MALEPSGRAGTEASAGEDAAEKHATAGDRFFSQFRYGPAMQQYWAAVRLRPRESKYHCKLAHAAWRAGVKHLVEKHFLEAVRLDPSNAAAHDGLGQWAVLSGAIARGMDHTAKAVELSRDNPEYIITRAYALATTGQIDAAWELIQPLLSAGEPSVRLALLYAEIAPRLGREAAALETIERASKNEKLPPDVRRQLDFAGASLLDRLGRYDQAFERVGVANRSAARVYDPREDERSVSARIEYFTAGRMRSLPRATLETRRAVFIVGMPRSGTSLVEQIVASHPQVHGGGEMDLLERGAQAAASAPWGRGQPYPWCLEGMNLRDVNELAAQHLAALESLDRAATYVTDKMPLNFLQLGLAELVLPQCRVIHCVRDPLDTCLSCYFSDFAGGHAFAYDLGHLGSFYRQYRRLMRHWKQVLTVPILKVRYEEVVKDPEGQTRRLLEFLGLPWDERCLRFHENPRHVATLSRNQVRRPIYSSSVGRWKHYEKYLPQLIAVLGKWSSP